MHLFKKKLNEISLKTKINWWKKEKTERNESLWIDHMYIYRESESDGYRAGEDSREKTITYAMVHFPRDAEVLRVYLSCLFAVHSREEIHITEAASRYGLCNIGNRK